MRGSAKVDVVLLSARCGAEVDICALVASQGAVAVGPVMKRAPTGNEKVQACSKGNVGGFSERRARFETRGAGIGVDLVLVRLVRRGSGVFLLLVVLEDRVGASMGTDRVGGSRERRGKVG